MYYSLLPNQSDAGGGSVIKTHDNKALRNAMGWPRGGPKLNTKFYWPIVGPIFF